MRVRYSWERSGAGVGWRTQARGAAPRCIRPSCSSTATRWRRWTSGRPVAAASRHGRAGDDGGDAQRGAAASTAAWRRRRTASVTGIVRARRSAARRSTSSASRSSQAEAFRTVPADVPWESVATLYPIAHRRAARIGPRLHRRRRLLRHRHAAGLPRRPSPASRPGLARRRTRAPASWTRCCGTTSRSAPAHRSRAASSPTASTFRPARPGSNQTLRRADGPPPWRPRRDTHRRHLAGPKLALRRRLMSDVAAPTRPRPTNASTAISAAPAWAMRASCR